LQTKFEPKRKEVEAKNAEIEGKKTQLRNMANTASEDMRRKLTNDIDQLQRSLQRFQEDAEAEFQGEQQKALSELGGRIMQVIDNYAKTNGYAVILDVSSQQSPVIWIANGIDVTGDIIALYDKNAPSTVNPAMPAKPTAAPPAAAPKKPAGAK
jgi:Skp family chaperone for outer membrane proteins